MKLVSIIIPCYNYGKYLPETILSLQKQSLQNWECVLVDNGSTDNTKEVCAAICKADSRFNYYYCDNNGPAAARNIGIKNTLAKYIQLLDADDLLEHDKLKMQVDYLEANTAVDLVYGEARYFTNDNPSLRLYSMEEGNKDWMSKISSTDKLFKRQLLNGNIMPIHAALFRRELIEKNGLMDEQLKGYEDWDLFLRFAFNGAHFKFMRHENAMALIRIHQSSLSKTSGHMNNYLFTVLQKTMCNTKMNFANRMFVLIRYYQQFFRIFFTKFRNSNITFINSDKVNSFKIFLLNIGAIIYSPFYLIIEGIKKVVRR